MLDITAITPDIHRVVVPFLDIFTTVFVVRTPAGALLFDTATYPEDADNYLIPALDELGVTAEELKYVFISHAHRDHVGGLERFMELRPDTCIVTPNEGLKEKFTGKSLFSPADGDMLLDVLRVVEIPGHTADAVGLLDTRTGTLLTGDGLQVFGIYGSGNWGANIGLPMEHLAALERIRALTPAAIYASHDYYPCGNRACTSADVARYTYLCAAALHHIRGFIAAHPELDNAALSALYNETTGLPKVGSHVFGGMRRAMEAGEI
ncbi:MAG: MBL fold metallo-hydrolase [Ruminococcaceae bacterium]|nr:MBL fold metallo-hydrolase [Oscillospiraceae bacterium]